MIILINESSLPQEYEVANNEDFEDALMDLTTLDLEDDQVIYPKTENRKHTLLFGGRGYDLYILDRPSLPASGPFEIMINDNNENIGFIRGTKKANTISFNLIHIKEDHRGYGIGSDIYEQLLKDGFIIKSDDEITDSTYSIYRKLSNYYKPLIFNDGRVGLMKENMFFESIVAYHGTPKGGFKAFSYKKIGSGADNGFPGDYGSGFYFTPDIEYAKKFAINKIKEKKIKNATPTIYKVELDIKNPLNLNKLSIYKHKIIFLIKEKGGFYNITDNDYQKLYKELSTTEDEIDFMNEIEGTIADNWADFDIGDILKEKSYDSLISHNKNEIVVFDKKKIKIIDTIKL